MQKRSETRQSCKLSMDGIVFICENIKDREELKNQLDIEKLKIIEYHSKKIMEDWGMSII